MSVFVYSFLNKTFLENFDFFLNSYITHPEKPRVYYPECFQGREIPVHGPAVAELIESRVAKADVPPPRY